ncbi:hypothetical protein HK100_009052 [Physocladia obscura]|uniref:Epg5-like TPR domain-containing protein n=1 Tax=Physocladia obscura TaxID=109957 RepID=A0AAD5XJH3_9FUNG|nr:hypothetical protein HK100_009052 [Physocladia obscura]
MEESVVKRTKTKLKKRTVAIAEPNDAGERDRESDLGPPPAPFQFQALDANIQIHVRDANDAHYSIQDKSEPTHATAPPFSNILAQRIMRVEYPSALHSDAQLVNVYYPEVADLPQIHNPEFTALEYEIITSDEVYPSAPPIELHQQIMQYVTPVPLEDTILEHIYTNSNLQESSKNITDFRKNAKYIHLRDKFFETVLEYEKSFSMSQISQSKIKSVNASIKLLTSKVWTMKKSTQKLTARCLDNNNLVHFVNSETAFLSLEDLNRLKFLLTVDLANLLHEKKTSLFQTKMLKLWIQTYIDEHLNEIYQAYSKFATIKNSDIQMLKYFLDVFFFFERRKDATFNENDAEGSNFNEAADANSFMRDIRGWISHVIGCSGIGAWGNWFIQWHPPSSSKWQDSFLDGYLSEIHIFLSPIEELQEEQHVKDIEQSYLVESLRALEESDEWIVVNETEVIGIDTIKAQLTILSDQDYCIFFKQFNIEAMYLSFLESGISLYKNNPEIKVKEKDRHLLRIFAVTNFIFACLSKGLFLFSSRNYMHILKAIANAIVTIVKILEDTMISNFGILSNDIALTVDSNLNTSVQSELDGSFVRAVAILLNRTRAGTWEYLKSLPCDLISDHMKFFLVNSILRGEKLSLQNLKSEIKSEQNADFVEDFKLAGLSTVLSSNYIEARCLLSFLTILSVSGSNSGYQSRLIERIARILFYFGFMDADYREDLKSECRNLLASICTSHPPTISLLVSWTRKNFSSMGHLSLFLFNGLPLFTWCPNTSDFDGFMAMLRDPVKSDKFELAKYIIGSLNWGLKPDSLADLFIPRSFHRFLALSVCNLYLDRFMKVPMFSMSTALSTTTALAKGKFSALLPSNEEDFYDWCWSTILSLSLYQPPTSLNTYALDSNNASRNKPFEALESAQLATLAGALKTSSLAAYTLLMISDVGHSTVAFEKDGWDMMRLLLDDKRIDAIIFVVNSMILSFVQTEGSQFILSAAFVSYFGSFIKSCNKSMISNVGKNFAENTAAQFFSVWSKIAFSDSDWFNNRISIYLLDTICQIAIFRNNHNIMCSELQQEYSRMLENNRKPSQYNVSLFHPVESMYTVASSFGNYFGSYPTLVSGSSFDWYTVPAALRNHLPAETEFFWFAFLALIVETQVEADIRMTLGNILSRESQTVISNVVKNCDKPLEYFSIYRWCEQILECDVGNPLLPLMIQAFFALYFEKCPNPVISINSCFGFRFFSEHRQKLERLQKKLQQMHLFEDTANTYQRPSLISENFGAEILINEAPHPVVTWIARQTIVTPHTQQTLSSVSTIIKQDFDIIFSKARDASKVHSDYLRSDIEYLNDLKNLYTNNSQSGRYERRCGSSCLGGAQFRFSYDDVQMQRDVNQRLQENRSHFETLSEWDNIDSRVCVCALKIVRAIEWATDPLNANSSNPKNIEEVFLQFFFKIVALDSNIRRYPPVEMIVRRAVNLIGEVYLKNSMPHVQKIFEILKENSSENSTDFLNKAFYPATDIDQFCNMYREFGCMETASVDLLQRFNLSEWLSVCANEAQKEFLEVLLSIFALYNSKIIKISQNAMSVHLENLRILISHESTEKQNVDFTVEIVKLFSNGQISELVFKSVVKTITMGVDRDTEKAVDEYELFELQFSHDQSVRFAKKMNDFLQEIFNNYDNGIYGLDHNKLKPLLELAALVFCSKSMFSMLSEVQKSEVASSFKIFCLLTVGISSHIVKPWFYQTDINFATLSITMIFKAMKKVFRSLSSLDDLANEYWEIFSTLIELDSPPFMISLLQDAMTKSDSDWKSVHSTFTQINLEYLTSVLPVCWTENIPSLKDFPEDSCFGFCWTTLLILTGFETVDKQKVVVDYIFKVLEMQVSTPMQKKIESTDNAKNEVTSFSNVTLIISEIMNQFANNDDVLLLHKLFRLLSVLNKTHKTMFDNVWEGITSSLASTSQPLLWLKPVCTNIASAEFMAILAEKCIERHVEKCSSNLIKWWDAVMNEFRVPELDVDAFLSHCLHYGLVYILYIYAVQNIIALQNTPRASELTNIVGVQLCNWILKINTNEMDRKNEGKIILLVDLFAQLLVRDLERLQVPMHHSRLFSMLPNFAEVLLKWSEPANQGLWTGFGLISATKNRFSPTFKVFCKSLATFIGMRLLETLDAEQKAKFVEKFSVLCSSSEYVDEIESIRKVIDFLQDDSLNLSNIREIVLLVGNFFAFVQMRALFSIPK